VQSFHIDLKTRQTSKKARREAIADNKVLGNIYGGNGESIAVQGDYRDVYKVIKTAGKNHPITLSVDGADIDVLVHDIEQDTISQRLHHITFRAFKKGEKIKTEVPVHVVGEAPALKLGLILVKVTDFLNVETQPSKIPDAFNVYVDGLEEEGQDVRVADLEIADDVTILEDENTLLVRIEMPRAQIEEEPEEEGEEGEEGETEGSEESEEDGDTEAKATDQKDT